MFKDFNLLAKLLKDEHFRKFLTNPKVRALMTDETFKRAVVEKNLFSLMANPQFAEFMRDPEIRAAFEALGQQMKAIPGGGTKLIDDYR